MERNVPRRTLGTADLPTERGVDLPAICRNLCYHNEACQNGVYIKF